MEFLRIEAVHLAGLSCELSKRGVVHFLAMRATLPSHFFQIEVDHLMRHEAHQRHGVGDRMDRSGDGVTTVDQLIAAEFARPARQLEDDVFRIG